MRLFKSLPPLNTIRSGCRIEDLPKKIHVLWLGSDIPNTPKREYMFALHRLAAQCKASDCELNLWLETPQQFYRPKDACELSYPNVKIRLINDICDDFKRLCTKDGYEALLLALQREMVGSSNYATVSDFLRVMILIIHGGGWLDFDIHVVPMFLKYKIDDTNSAIFLKMQLLALSKINGTALKSQKPLR